jgi:allantoin racemase
VEEDGAEVICLGCAGMAGLEEALRESTGVPVIDGVPAAVVLVQSLVSTGARTSKRNLYRPVDPRPALQLPDGIAIAYGTRRDQKELP